MQAETEQVLQQHGCFLCRIEMLSFPRWDGVEVTTVQVELLRPPEEMVRGGGHQSLDPFMESGRKNSLCKFRICWLPTRLLNIYARLLSSEYRQEPDSPLRYLRCSN